MLGHLISSLLPVVQVSKAHKGMIEQEEYRTSHSLFECDIKHTLRLPVEHLCQRRLFGLRLRGGLALDRV